MTAPDPDATQAPASAQPLVAAGVAICLAALAGWFVAAGGLSGRLVHHDTAPPVERRFTVDVNEAPEAELAQLPGFGAAMARRLVDHRRQHGPFATVDELLDVPGIGPAKLAALRPHLRPIAAPQPAAPIVEARTADGTPAP
jgi:competence protein ComEA